MEDTESPKTILVVEDNSSHAELIVRSFADAAAAHDLKQCSTLHEARHEISRHPPDLVLADYRLPDGDGIELVSYSEGRFPLVIMTSQGNEDIAVEAIKAGAMDYLVKTVDTFDSMPRTVDRVLRDWKLVAEKARAEEELIRSELRFRTLFEKANEGILYLAPTGCIVSVNEAFARMHGYTPEEMKGSALHDLDPNFSPEDMASERTRRILTGEKMIFEVVHYHKDGHLIPLEVSVSTIEISGELFFVAFHRDISERKRLEEQTRQLQQTQRLESLGVLAGGIAHDFNNLLMVIQGNAELMKDKVTPESPSWDNLQKIETAAIRSAELCRQMLSYAGKNQMSMEHIYLHTMISEMLELLKSSISKKTEIALHIEPNQYPVLGDTSQIRQVIMNLIINASEAIGEQNGVITISSGSIDVGENDGATSCLGETIPPGKFLHLTVTDTGCGMDEQTRQRIFEPFFTTKFTGRGLGLSAVLGIVKSHHSFLRCSSVPGNGTTFRILFPHITNAVQHMVQSAAPETDWKGSGTILLVDDEAMVRAVGQEMLKALGYEVLTAENGREAVEIFRNRGEGIDVVILDMAMPKMDGIETFHELLRLDSHVKVVLSSGYSGNEAVAQLSDKGLAGFIHKPYAVSRLKQVLSDLTSAAP